MRRNSSSPRFRCTGGKESKASKASKPLPGRITAVSAERKARQARQARRHGGGRQQLYRQSKERKSELASPGKIGQGEERSLLMAGRLPAGPPPPQCAAQRGLRAVIPWGDQSSQFPLIWEDGITVPVPCSPGTYRKPRVCSRVLGHGQGCSRHQHAHALARYTGSHICSAAAVAAALVSVSSRLPARYTLGVTVRWAVGMLGTCAPHGWAGSGVNGIPRPQAVEHLNLHLTGFSCG